MSFLLLSLFFFSSCTKENIHSDPKVKEDGSSSATIQYCFDNPDNPYEYVGVQHNLGLDAVAASADLNNLSVEKAYYIAYETVANNLGANQQVPFELIKDAFVFMDHAEPLLAAADFLVTEGDISDQAYQQIIKLNYLLDNSPDPQTLGLAILDLEKEIMQNTAYTTFELEVLLGGTSIARHSTCYWINAALDPNSPWYPYFHTNTLNGQAADRDLIEDIGEIFKPVVEFVKKDITGYKTTKKVVKKILPDGSIVTEVISVVVGVVYSVFAKD